MMKHNIFSEDVTVPEIVKEKAESAFFAIQTERMDRTGHGIQKKRKGNRKRVGKTAWICVAAAACMALVIVTEFWTGHTNEVREGDTIRTALHQIDKMFTLQVKAEEAEDLLLLTEGEPVPVTIRDSKAGSWVFGANDLEGGILNYCINIPPIICEGSQIESITYSVNNGVFQIVQPENEESIIVDGQRADDAFHIGSIGGDYDEERDGMPSRPFETVYYQSITLDYDRQSGEYTWINLCKERDQSEEIIQLLWGEDVTIEAYNRGIQKMLDSTILTCTVNYTDHTSQSVDIKVDSHVMTRREAGEPLDPGMDPRDLDEKTAVITFELQPQTDN